MGASSAFSFRQDQAGSRDPALFLPPNAEMDTFDRIETLRHFYDKDYARPYRGALLSLLTALECVLLWNNLRKWAGENEVLQRHPLRQLLDPYPLRFLVAEGVIERIGMPTLRRGPYLEKLLTLMEDDWRDHETHLANWQR